MHKNDNFLIGRHSIEELLKYNPDQIKEIFIVKTSDSRNQQIISKIQKADIPYKFVDKNKLNQISQTQSHQGVLAILKQRQYLSIDKMVNDGKSTLLMLDGIEDPQNFGAILRSCECFDVDGVIFSKNRNCDITPAVTKTSCGASELLKIAKVANLHDTLLKLKKEGYEIIIADNCKEAVEIQDFDFPKKSLIIMGSEKKGVRHLLKKNCDFIVKIPIFGKISSLNVATATSIFLFKAKVASQAK
jgi:23S rRNA (guanosine2251-2'-O)-methyltransferase